MVVPISLNPLLEKRFLEVRLKMEPEKITEAGSMLLREVIVLCNHPIIVSQRTTN